MRFLDLMYDLIGLLLFALYCVLVVGIVIRVVMKRRPIGVSLAWLAAIFAIPILGVTIYLLFGEVHLGRKRVERHYIGGRRFWLPGSAAR